MPDEFPTLEVVALIGVLAAVVRTLQLRVALTELPKLGAELQRAIRAGDLKAAQNLCDRTEGAAFARVGSAVVASLAQRGGAAPNELRRVVRDEKKRAATAAQRKRGRDLVVAAVLIGAGAYALRGGLGVGTAFYALLGIALVITALGPVLRRASLSALESESDRLLAAALEFRRPAAARGAGPCPECGAREAVEVSGEALGALGALGVESLRICRECGAVRGRADVSAASALEAIPGLRVAQSEPAAEAAADPESEHQG